MPPPVAMLQMISGFWNPGAICLVAQLVFQLMLVDVVIPPVHEFYFGKFIDLNMLVMTGGLERTEDEFSQAFGGLGPPLVSSSH